MEEFIHFNLFYVFLFAFLVIVVITICGTIKFMNGNTTQKGVVENIKDIFFKSSDNAKEITLDNNKVHMDTTTKMANMHTEVVDGIPTQYQHELHSIEETVKKETTRLDKLVDDMEEVNQKLDILLEWKFETERKKKA